MDIKIIQQNWESLAQRDPFWAVLSWDNKKGNQWNKEEFFKTGISEVDDVLAYVENLKPVVFGKALDFGCGLGRLTEALAAKFEEVVGVDISASMIKGAQEMSKRPNASYVLNQTDNLRTLEDNSFDFIYSRLTLQHIPPELMRKYLAEFARILKPGGVLVFVIPDRVGLSKVRLTNLGHPADLLNMLLPDTALNLLRYGIGVIKKAPVMEMHSMKGSDIVKYLQVLKLLILEVSEYGKLNPGWKSVRYIVTK